MKIRHGLAALVVFALSLPGLRASAQAPDASDESESKAKPAPPAEPVAPAEPVEAPRAAPAAAPAAERYIGFAPPPPPLRVENSSASIQFGILAQPQFEVAGSADADGTTKNLFVRRFRLMVGGTVFKTFEYFFQTDWPNLFKLDPADTMAFDKNAPGLNIQDAFVTWRLLGPLGDRITRWIDVRLDAGFMLPPLSHNSLESAGKLYGGDFFINTFRRNMTNNTDPFRAFGQSPVGRDAGVQARFLVLNGHIDFRFGAFMGKRTGAVPAAAPMPATVGGVNMFRFAGRVQINLLDAEPGFFYQGTYLGARKIVSFGGFYDFQDQYKYFGADALVDLPLGPGVLTAQGNIGRWEGGTWVPLVKQTVYLGEIGYLIGPIMLSPILRYERLVSPLIANPDPMMPGMIADPANPSENRYGGGLAFWPYGHTSNIKIFYSRVNRAPSLHQYDQFNVQWQVSYY
jgi:hypothetical protein